ncbi:hypothetical protein BN11_3960002 [Nostocoides australiense Ben110]|uniref:Uncharacterized protein n=1 Tax=Nostocoides australiense Ben110 TaxID=1193182 RepID=W6JZC1_9MICO|nr:hypothetical protein BN11_3960002 [Tetrasphaera australiensis Ben110]
MPCCGRNPSGGSRSPAATQERGHVVGLLEEAHGEGRLVPLAGARLHRRDDVHDEEVDDSDDGADDAHRQQDDRDHHDDGDDRPDQGGELDVEGVGGIGPHEWAAVLVHEPHDQRGDEPEGASAEHEADQRDDVGEHAEVALVARGERGGAGVAVRGLAERALVRSRVAAAAGRRALRRIVLRRIVLRRQGLARSGLLRERLGRVRRLLARVDRLVGLLRHGCFFPLWRQGSGPSRTVPS